MSNSSLVSYTKISPNKTSPRNHVIDTITIHCMAGNLSVEGCGNLFAQTSREASSNYGIGSDGRIAMYVEEKDRSWCSGGRDKNGNTIRVNGISGADNDHRAVTIEVANDIIGGEWHVSDKALNSLIKLCADICKRNGIKKLLWKADKGLVGQVDKQNMTVHRWFANKECPGLYLLNKHSYIADEVNKLLGINEESVKEEVKADTVSNCPFKVKVSINDLNIRTGAGTNYKKTGKYTGVGVFTITEVKQGAGSKKGWGKLKSGAGWISLDYCEVLHG